MSAGASRAARTALLAGASGLVGGECLQLLVAAPEYSRVIVLTRRDLGARAPHHAKVEQVVGDFANLEANANRLRADDVYCCLGTTIRKAGSQAAFREVDFGHVQRLAQVTRRAGARHFSLVSAAGASRTAAFFYSRVKGEIEAALQAMDWPSLAILRPSVIAGERAESRPLERLAQQALRWAPAPWRSVAARDIAAAMIVAALDGNEGTRIVESGAIPALARGR